MRRAETAETPDAAALASGPESRRWEVRRDVILTVLGWFAAVATAIFLLSRIAHVVILLVLASLLAYLLYPAVIFLERRLPRFAAIAFVYLLAMLVIGSVGYLIIRTAAEQAVAISGRAHELLSPARGTATSPLASVLHRFGIGDQQIAEARQQATAQVERLAGEVLPVLKGLVNSVLDAVLVLVLSIYLLADGERAGRFIRENTPRSKEHYVRLLRGTLQKIVGGYVRGQLFLSALIGLLVGGGMFLFRVPGAALLGLLAFLLSFVPILGTIVSGAACVLLALTKGWVTAVLVLGYFVLMHVIEGDVLGPRIVGRALGIHPVVSILAVIGGAELFGIKGALFAAPVIGFVQALVVAIWMDWRAAHPAEFASAPGGDGTLEPAEHPG